jgi:hypothetical protein
MTHKSKHYNNSIFLLGFALLGYSAINGRLIKVSSGVNGNKILRVARNVAFFCFILCTFSYVHVAACDFQKVHLSKMNLFTLHTNLIFLQDRLLPHFNVGHQKQNLYYERKLKHYIFGIVEPSVGRSYIYLTDEPNVNSGKDSNLVANYIVQYVS